LLTKVSYFWSQFARHHRHDLCHRQRVLRRHRRLWRRHAVMGRREHRSAHQGKYPKLVCLDLTGDCKCRWQKRIKSDIAKRTYHYCFRLGLTICWWGEYTLYQKLWYGSKLKRTFMYAVIHCWKHFATSFR